MSLSKNSQSAVHDRNAQARFNMIEQQIRPWNVLDEGVLELLQQVRREDFVPPEHTGLAFMDLEIPLLGSAEEAYAKGWCMWAPRVEARTLQDLEIKPTDRVLEIGAGSGHMAALLAASAKEVVTLEVVPELAEMARENLLSAGFRNVDVQLADGSQAAAGLGQFDIILLSGSVGILPEALFSQLNDGGRLSAVVGQQPMMRSTLAKKKGHTVDVAQPWDVVTARLTGFAEPSRFTF